MASNQEYTSFGRQVIYVIIAQAATSIIAIIQIPILTRGLGATQYGIFSLITATVALISAFALLGLSTSVIRFLSGEKDKARLRDGFLSAYLAVALSGAVFSALLFASSAFLADSIIKDPGSVIYIRLASILIILSALNALTIVFFRVFRQIGRYAIVIIAYKVFEIVLIAVSLYMGYQLPGVIVALILNNLLFDLILLFVVLKQIGFQLPGFSDLKPYLAYSLPLILNPTILWIIINSDRYLVTYFLGVTANGVYSAAYEIGNFASFILMPLITVLYPTLAKSYDESNLTQTKTYFKYSVKYLMLIAIPSAFGLSLLAKPLLAIFTTPEFVPGTGVVPFIAFGAVLFGFFQICIYVVHLVKKTYWSLILMSLAAIVNIVLNLFLIPLAGILGAAIATFIAYGMLGVLTLLLSRKYLQFDLSLLFIVKSCAASAAMSVFLWLVNPQTIIAVIISIAAAVLIYFALLYAMKSFSKEEITFFNHFIKDHIRKTGITGKG